MAEKHDSHLFGFEDTSFQAAGGIKGIQKLVKAFYRHMDRLPEAKALRAMHAEDLTESEEKLGRFLCGWLGGPKLYQEKYGPINIPRAHAHLHITPETKEAWLLCMKKAVTQQPYSVKFANYLMQQFRIPADRILDATKTQMVVKPNE